MLNKSLLKIFDILPASKIKYFIEKSLGIFESKNKSFCTYHSRPKYVCGIQTFSDRLINTPITAMVIQGAVLKENDFTLESIKTYKKIFSGSIIILSTWEDEDPEYLEKIKKENIVILLNKRPEYSGQQNINYQIISSLNGLKKAGELGAEYAIKTRTDQRIYGFNLNEFLVNLVEKFPIDRKWKQNKRIVGINLNSFKFRLYGVSDMFLFGDIQDMIIYFSPELDKRKLGEEIKNCKTTRDFCNLRLCEIYLSSEFLSKVGRELKWTLEDSFRVFADHFIIIDKETIDLYWPKYSRYKEYRYLNYKNMTFLQELNFREWFNLYSNFNNKLKISEKILDIKTEENFCQESFYPSEEAK